MSKRNRNRNRDDEQAAATRVVESRLWLAIPVCLLILAVAFAVFRSAIGRQLGQAEPEVSSTAAEPADSEVPLDKIAGVWQRTDGGYILQLTEPAEGGQLTAHYFNPNPINVGNAEWRADKGDLLVFVELRDVNYPGSSYALKYQPRSDQLFGTYYQATMGERYDVEFVRLPDPPPGGSADADSSSVPADNSSPTEPAPGTTPPP